MRKSLIAGVLTGSVTLFAAAGASAHTINAGVTSGKAPTVTLGFQADAQNLTVKSIGFDLPKELKLNTKSFPTCSVQKLQSNGPASCPAGSKVGSGSIAAVLGTGEKAKTLPFSLTIFNGSAKSLALYVKGLLAYVMPAQLTKGSTGFGDRLQVSIPPALQQPLPGVYAHLTSLKATIKPIKAKAVKSKRKGKGAKKAKKVAPVTFVTSTGCPASKTFKFQALLDFAPNLLPAPPEVAVPTQVNCS